MGSHTYIKSQKGNDQLVFNGYFFEEDSRKNDEHIYWRCVETKRGCKGRAIQDESGVREGRNEHDHPPRMMEIEVRRALGEIRSQAGTQHAETPHSVVAGVISGVTEDVLGSLPSTQAMKNRVQRRRNMLSGQPAAPVSIGDFQLKGNFSVTNNGEQFLLADTGGERNRILVFATGRNLELLYQCRHWMADGTFKSAPQHFVQIWTIHIVKSDVVIPVVYALLPNKQKESNIRVLRILKERHVRLDPELILTDFEESEIRAFKEVFPAARLRGCYFHFSQCIWRKIQSTPEFLTCYGKKVEFAFNLRKLMALAFIPPADTEHAFDLLCESPFFTNREHVRILAPLLDYFQETWIGRIKKEQSMTELKLAQLNAGAESSKGKKKYIDLNKKILNIVSQYPSLSLDDYLSGLAARLSS
ncbi:hypothetical protein R1sor_006532 [Riccia sorocarpa]|uniref:MULE transposase domain-containing protein n=1 Tax=Riccia sorocarpa TaxID=122646 RepID=A0ABD3HPL1_9MARC